MDFNYGSQSIFGNPNSQMVPGTYDTNRDSGVQFHNPGGMNVGGPQIYGPQIYSPQMFQVPQNPTPSSSQQTLTSSGFSSMAHGIGFLTNSQDLPSYASQNSLANAHLINLRNNPNLTNSAKNLVKTAKKASFKANAKKQKVTPVNSQTYDDKKITEDILQIVMDIRKKVDNLESAEKDRNDREMALQAEMKAHMDMKIDEVFRMQEAISKELEEKLEKNFDVQTKRLESNMNRQRKLMESLFSVSAAPPPPPPPTKPPSPPQRKIEKNIQELYFPSPIKAPIAPIGTSTPVPLNHDRPVTRQWSARNRGLSQENADKTSYEQNVPEFNVTEENSNAKSKNNSEDETTYFDDQGQHKIVDDEEKFVSILPHSSIDRPQERPKRALVDLTEHDLDLLDDSF